MLVFHQNAQGLSCVFNGDWPMLFVAIALLSAPPVNRVMPELSHHLVRGSVLVVSETVDTESATLVSSTWLRGDSDVGSLSFVYDGAIINNGTEPALIIDIDGGEAIWLSPGENLVVEPTTMTPGYTYGCICKCCDGWVFAGTKNPCTGYNNTGECINPKDDSLCTGFTDCKKGWGQASMD